MLRFSILPVLVLGSFGLLLDGCGNERPPQFKDKRPERVTQAVSTSAPGEADGWSLFETAWETAHPYKNRDTQVFTITHPGAAEIRVKFEDFDTESGYDYVKLSTPEGGSTMWYTGRLGDFWSKSIPGPSVRVELSTDRSLTRFGFRIAGYAMKADGEPWETTPFVWETAHPYRDGEYQVVEISEPRAIKMKLLFGEFVTEEGWDFVSIYNEAGLLVAEYTGNLGKFETPAIEGRKLFVAFSSDESITETGVSIAQYSFVPEAANEGCMCIMLYAPVCGENGKTYGNSCEAACEQVPVAHPGACGQPGDFCGGIAGLTCAANLNCTMNGNYPDAGGTCTEH